MITVQYRVRVRHCTHVKFQRPRIQTRFVFLVDAPAHSRGAKIAAQRIGMPKSLRVNGASFWSNKTPHDQWPSSGRKNYTEWLVDRIW